MTKKHPGYPQHCHPKLQLPFQQHCEGGTCANKYRAKEHIKSTHKSTSSSTATDSYSRLQGVCDGVEILVSLGSLPCENVGVEVLQEGASLEGG